MNFKHLETFVCTARGGGFSAAAGMLNTTQPAVSMRMRELERTLDATLIDRSRRRIRLTPKGREFLEYAERIVALNEEAQARFGSARKLAGRIRLGVTETVALTWLPDLVRRINETYPEVVLELDVDLTAGVWDKLNAGDLEVALLPGPVHGPNIDGVPLGRIRYVWMASPKLNIPDRRLTPRDLAAWPVITLSQESNLYVVIEDWFRGHRAEPRRIDVCNSVGVVAALTMAGIGISLLPPSIFRREVERGQLRVIDTKPSLAALEFQAVYARGGDSPLVKFVVDLSRQVSTFHFRNLA